MGDTPERFIIHATPGIPWQKRYAGAILEGLEEVGLQARTTPGQDTDAGIHIILGPNAFRSAYASLRGEGRNVITINRAFIGSVLGHEKDPFVAIGWNGYNHNAVFPFAFGDELPYSRALDSFWKSIKPAKARQGSVLILGEYATPDSFLKQAISDCESLGMPWWFRPHPTARATSRRLRMCPYDRLSTACDESTIALTHHSTAACEALLRGLPVVVYDPESMCAPVCPAGPLTATTPLHLPDRTSWVEWLAWTQWTIREIAAGEPWRWIIDTYRKLDPHPADMP